MPKLSKALRRDTKIQRKNKMRVDNKSIFVVQKGHAKKEKKQRYVLVTTNQITQIIDTLSMEVVSTFVNNIKVAKKHCNDLNNYPES